MMEEGYESCIETLCWTFCWLSAITVTQRYATSLKSDKEDLRSRGEPLPPNADSCTR